MKGRKPVVEFNFLEIGQRVKAVGKRKKWPYQYSSMFNNSKIRQNKPERIKVVIENGDPFFERIA